MSEKTEQPADKQAPDFARITSTDPNPPDPKNRGLEILIGVINLGALVSIVLSGDVGWLIVIGVLIALVVAYELLAGRPL